MTAGVHINGTTPGHPDVLKKNPSVPAKAAPPKQEQHILNTIRCLGADLCQQFNGGHPGTVMGAAAIGISLWRYQMRYNPSNADWFARDRFVLSAGHACLLQYIMLHLSGYPDWTLDAIKNYHAPTMDGIAAGHPEIEYPGIEVTTGPLGQGIANAVGMAMAGKNLQALYNKPDYEVIGQKIWCFTGDGCLQEGVGQEALSIAGHFGLDNLVLIYDNNNTTVDGSIDNCFTDDTSSRVKAAGWNVIDVFDGSNDLTSITNALDQAREFKGKPTMVNIRTIIGIGSRKASTGTVHGQALGVDEVKYVKEQLGFDPEKKFVVSDDVYDYFKECKVTGEKLESEWKSLIQKYNKAYPELGKELERRISGKLSDWENVIPKKNQLPSEPTATRKSSGVVFQSLVPNDNSFVAGSADLLESTFVSWKGMVEFQNPKSGLGDYAGRQIRWGIREHAMCAACNGIAAYQKGTFLPIMSTFFMFWLYAAPAARMAALQGLRFIGIGTHDSIGIGEDGPTHQPIALASFYRSLPGLNFFRPADAEEVAGSWIYALRAESQPSLFAFSRQPVPLLEGSDRDKVQKGGYVIYGKSDIKPDLTIVSAGSEVTRAVDTAKLLEKEGKLAIRVVSIPCFALYDRQSQAYKRETIPTKNSLVVVVEAYASFGWSRYAHAGCHMHGFGHSAPQAMLFEHFGFGPDNLAKKIGAWVETRRSGDGWDVPGVGEYEELLIDQVRH